MFGAPATRRRYTANAFDYVRVEDGKIVERIQQADVLGQLRQLFGPLLLGALAGAARQLLDEPPLVPLLSRFDRVEQPVNLLVGFTYSVSG